MREKALAIVLGLGWAAAGPAAAATGAAELLLDRPAVASVIAAQIPPPSRIPLGQFGQVTVKLEPPEAVAFANGAVEARLGVRIVEAGLAGGIVFRMAPEVDERTGVVRLRTVRARGEGALALLPDLAALLRPIELPRTFDSALEGPRGARTPLTVTVRGVEVQSERVLIRLGIETRPKVAPQAAPK